MKFFRFSSSLVNSPLWSLQVSFDSFPFKAHVLCHIFLLRVSTITERFLFSLVGTASFRYTNLSLYMSHVDMRRSIFWTHFPSFEHRRLLLKILPQKILLRELSFACQHLINSFLSNILYVYCLQFTFPFPFTFLFFPECAVKNWKTFVMLLLSNRLI